MSIKKLATTLWMFFFFSLSYAGTARFHNINMDSSFTVKRCVGASTLDSLFGIQNGSRVMKAAPTSALTVDSARAAYKADSLTCLYAQIKTVAKGCGQYTTIQAAINSISDASVSKRYCVYVYPGKYTEQVTLKEGVDLIGVGKHVVQLEYYGDTNGTVIMADYTQVQDVLIEAVTDSNCWAIVSNNAHDIHIRNVDLLAPFDQTKRSKGIKITGDTYKTVFIEQSVINCYSSTSNGIYIAGGSASPQDVDMWINDVQLDTWRANTGGGIFIKDCYGIHIKSSVLRTSLSGYNVKTVRTSTGTVSITMDGVTLENGASSLEIGANTTVNENHCSFSSVDNGGTFLHFENTHVHNKIVDSLADTTAIKAFGGTVGICTNPGARYLSLRQNLQIIGDDSCLIEAITGANRSMIFRAHQRGSDGAGMTLYPNANTSFPGTTRFINGNKTRMKIDSSGLIDSIYSIRMRWLANYATDSVMTARGDGMVGYRSMSGMDVDSARAASIADSTKKNAAHGVTSGYVPFSEGTNLWDDSDLRYNESYTNFGVGIAAASNVKFYVNSGATNALRYNLYALNQPNITTTGSYGAYGFNFYAYTSLSNGANDSGSYYGGYGRALHSDTGYVGSINGLTFRYGSTIALATSGAIGGITFQPYLYGNTGSFANLTIQAPLGSGVATDRLNINSLDTAIFELQGGIRIDSDTKRFWLGEDQDASIYHDGSNVVYTATTGNHTFSDGAISMIDSSRIGWTLHDCDSVVSTYGTVIGGRNTLDSLGDSVLTIEEVTTDGINVVFWFKNVGAFNWIELLAGYSGSSSHCIRFYARNYTKAKWVNLGALYHSTLIDTTNSSRLLENKSFFIGMQNDYDSSGIVKVQTMHTGSGISSHRLYIDALRVFQ